MPKYPILMVSKVIQDWEELLTKRGQYPIVLITEDANQFYLYTTRMQVDDVQGILRNVLHNFMEQPYTFRKYIIRVCAKCHHSIRYPIKAEPPTVCPSCGAAWPSK